MSSPVFWESYFVVYVIMHNRRSHGFMILSMYLQLCVANMVKGF